MERKRRKADTSVPRVCFGAHAPKLGGVVLLTLLTVGGQHGGERYFTYLRRIAVVLPRTTGIWVHASLNYRTVGI